MRGQSIPRKIKKKMKTVHGALDISIPAKLATSAGIALVLVSSPATADSEPLTPVVEIGFYEEYTNQYGLTQIGAANAYSKRFTGKGVTVGVIDTGIDGGHEEFIDKIVLTSGLVGGTDGLTDPEGHGTHVSGIIAAAHDDYQMHGVAFDAKLAVFRNTDKTGGTPSFAVEAAAIDQMTAIAGIKIVNNSYGISTAITDITRQEIEDEAPELVAATKASAAREVLMVWSTGNHNYHDASAEAGLPLYFPELRNNWLAVTAVDRTSTLSFYSNACGVSMEWCLAAPGGDGDRDGILSVLPDHSYGYLSGTSIAAPHVSGVQQPWCFRPSPIWTRADSNSSC
jgi:subtilisin family serine protease